MWQQKDQSEMDKVKEELKYLETGTKPEPVSSPNIGALQVGATTHVQGFDFVASDWLREDESIIIIISLVLETERSFRARSYAFSSSKLYLSEILQNGVSKPKALAIVNTAFPPLTEKVRCSCFTQVFISSESKKCC